MPLRIEVLKTAEFGVVQWTINSERRCQMVEYPAFLFPGPKKFKEDNLQDKIMTHTHTHYKTHTLLKTLVPEFWDHDIYKLHFPLLRNLSCILKKFKQNQPITKIRH